MATLDALTSHDDALRDVNECLAIIGGYGELLRDSIADLSPEVVTNALDAIARYTEQARAAVALLGSA